MPEERHEKLSGAPSAGGGLTLQSLTCSSGFLKALCVFFGGLCVSLRAQLEPHRECAFLIFDTTRLCEQPRSDSNTWSLLLSGGSNK